MQNYIVKNIALVRKCFSSLSTPSKIQTVDTRRSTSEDLGNVVFAVEQALVKRHIKF